MGIVLESSLQVFFYEVLEEINQKLSRPLPKETIFYCSLVMDKYGDSGKFFENVDGKIKEKILGLKLLEAGMLPVEKQKNVVKDVAETSLVLCGYFSESFNGKLVDVKYYQEVGMMAYSRLNSFSPTAYDVPFFYKAIAKTFFKVTLVLELASKKLKSDKDSPWLIVDSGESLSMNRKIS